MNRPSLTALVALASLIAVGQSATASIHQSDFRAPVQPSTKTKCSTDALAIAQDDANALNHLLEQCGVPSVKAKATITARMSGATQF